MRKISNCIVRVIFLGIITVMCCSCGASLKSMKDADDFIKKKRIEALKRNVEPGAWFFTPEVTELGASGSLLLLGVGLLTASVPMDYIAAAAYAPTTLISAPAKVKKRSLASKTINIKTRMGSPVIVLTRKEPGKPEWNLKNEVIKRVGDVPKLHDACKIKEVDLSYASFPKKYKGEDGEITIDTLMFCPMLQIHGEYGITPDCTMEDLLICKDYMRKFASALAHILLEENAKLDAQLFQEYPDLKNFNMDKRDLIYWRDMDTKEKWTELPDGRMVPGRTGVSGIENP